MSKTQLIIIRHGETDFNKDGRYCGFSDPSLNRMGVLQAQSVHQKLKGTCVDKVYSSDLKRSRETAKIIFKNQTIEQKKEFREINFGLWEGLTYDEIMVQHGASYSAWLDDLANETIPQGEGLKEFSCRVMTALEEVIMEYGGKTVALVVHGGVSKVVLCHALGRGLESFLEIPQDNAAVNIINYTSINDAKVIVFNER